MNTIHNNGENDKSLIEGMDKLDQAYAQLPDEQPPQLLDQAILNKAHRAVEKKSHWMQFGWVHGLTTAAVVVLTISLVFNQREQVPGLENELRVEESIPLQRERVARKKSDEVSRELKEKRENPQDVMRSAAPAASPQGDLMEVTVSDQAVETMEEDRRTVGASKIQADNMYRDDKDTSANEPIMEERFSDEAVLASDSPVFEVSAKQTKPATVAAGLAAETDDLSDMEDEITRQLQEIILLKQAGNESWMTRLQQFRTEHPDYPLPEELSN
jgi:hypothetical protein